MRQYEVQRVGSAHRTEWWVPAQDVETLKENIVGIIEVIGEYHGWSTT